MNFTMMHGSTNIKFLGYFGQCFHTRIPWNPRVS